jgi:hypothetical protein
LTRPRVSVNCNFNKASCETRNRGWRPTICYAATVVGRQPHHDNTSSSIVLTR